MLESTVVPFASRAMKICAAEVEGKAAVATLASNSDRRIDDIPCESGLPGALRACALESSARSYRPFVVSGFSRTRLLAAGGMLAVAPELDFVSGLFAMLAAVLSVGSVWLDDALTGGVRTLRC